MNLEVLGARDALASRAVDVIVGASARAIDERGQFTFAVSGGSTPRPMLEQLAERDDIEWPRVHLFQVDERIAPDGHEDRNATMLEDALLTPAFLGRTDLAGVWLMPVGDAEPVGAARRYGDVLDRVAGSPVVLDLVQLGLGSDGHTASLVPGDPILEVTDVDVAVTDVYQGRRRMSLTWPVLDRAKEQLWVIAGADKHDALNRYLDGDPTIPATLPTQARATVLVDEDAFRG